jgi:hypothetical protein
MEQRNIIPVFAKHSTELALAIFDAANRQPTEKRDIAQAAAGILLRNLLVLEHQVPDLQKRMQIALSGLVTKQQPLPKELQVDQTTLQQLSTEQATVFFDIYQEAVEKVVATQYGEDSSVAQHYDKLYNDRKADLIEPLSEIYGKNFEPSSLSTRQGIAAMEKDLRFVQAMQERTAKTA